MNKLMKYVSVVTTVTVISISTNVLADPLSSQLQNQKSQLQQDQQALKNAQSNSQDLEIKLEKLDNQIEGVMSQISDNRKQINITEQNIAQAEKDLQKAEDDTKAEKDLFGQRMRAMYINGSDGYLDIILSSKGFSDLLSNVEAVTKIIEYDNKIIADLKAKQEEINKKKDALDVQNTKLLALKADNEKKLDQLNSDKADQSKLVVQAKAQEKIYSSKVSATQAALNETMNQIKAIRSTVPKYTPSRGAVPISSNAVIAYASNFLGTPYLWGGTTPAGFDCSGFTQYVYRHFGVTIGRTTYDQINNGYAVSRDALQPGDLIFFGSSGNPTHVGIYVGNGVYINAPHTGDVVKIASINRSDYLTARRVM
ncbi:NlpC/P60 family protein [Candidatus Clostridium stratigraminis]|uniref:NlpC/P60 family protein n=1 Tax=Candidatus Clostridium stratigraminis TaxID=3381661 RepID=A0ABW8T8L1_9CLOT